MQQAEDDQFRAAQEVLGANELRRRKEQSQRLALRPEEARDSRDER